MGRAFVTASSQGLSYAGAVLAAEPLTMACWAFVDNLTATHCLMSLTDGTSNSRRMDLLANGAATGDPVQAFKQNSGTSDSAGTSAAYPSGTWFHAAAVFAGATSRAAYLNGASKGTNATSIATPVLNKTGLGYLPRLTAASYLSGRMAEAGIWNVALSDAEVLTLARGVSPLMVRPEALIAYWPLLGRYAPENDLLGGFPLTLSASPPAQAAHPRILYPSRPRLTPQVIVIPPYASLVPVAESAGMDRVTRSLGTDSVTRNMAGDMVITTAMGRA